MKATIVLFMVILALPVPDRLYGQQTPNPDFATLAQACAPNVHKDTISALVSVESSFNPYAIGVVDGRLSRQPNNITEALGVVRELEEKNFNYSLGLSQVNKKNFPRLGIDAQIAFDPCKNLIAGSKILSECYDRARKGGLDEQDAVRAGLSCYYSGNFTRGFKDGYVREVVGRVGKVDTATPIKIIKTDNTTKPTRTAGKQSAGKQQRESKRDSDSAFVF